MNEKYFWKSAKDVTRVMRLAIWTDPRSTSEKKEITKRQISPFTSSVSLRTLMQNAKFHMRRSVNVLFWAKLLSRNPIHRATTMTSSCDSWQVWENFPVYWMRMYSDELWLKLMTACCEWRWCMTMNDCEECECAGTVASDDWRMMTWTVVENADADNCGWWLWWCLREETVTAVPYER